MRTANISFTAIVLASSLFLSSCSSITKPIEGKYVEKGGNGTLLLRADGTFHEDPPKSQYHSGEGVYENNGTQLSAGYKFKDGGGFAMDVNHGKRLDDDTLLWEGRTFMRQPSAQASGSSSNSSPSTNNSPLSVDKVQRAVDKALDWTRKGGGATVSGIQELPQENAARADIRFDGFQYNADGAGTPVSKDKQGPPKPAINDPAYYRKMAEYGLGQTQVKMYSGTGIGILKHYNDGRWMLTEVHFDFEGVRANIEIQ